MITVNKANPTPGEVTSSLTGSTGDGAGLNLADAGNIESATSDAIKFGTSDFSIEFILDQKSDNDTDNIIFTTNTVGTNYVYIMNDISANVLSVVFVNSSAAVLTRNISYDMSADYGTPTHYVLTADRSGLATLYKNGNSVGTVDISAESAIDLGSGNSNPQRIGSIANYGVLGTFYRFRTWNKLVDAKALFERADVGYADQYGSQTETSTNSFAESVAFAGFSGNAGGFTTSGSATNNAAYKNQTFTAGKKYRLKFTIADGNSSNLLLLFRSSTGGAGSNVGKIDSSNLGTVVSDTYLQLEVTGNYELILSDLGSAQSIRIYAGGDVGAINISGFSIVQIGAVVDMDLAFANPTQSLTVQDRAGAADGTCSASGVSQVQPVVQLNATAARIGTVVGNPPDGELYVSSKARIGQYAIQGGSILGVRNQGDSINFGHNNSAGYGSTIGCGVSNGWPHLALMCEAGTNVNTFKTRGLKGNVVYATNTGEFKIGQVTTADADNQTVTDRLTISSTGQVGVGCDPANPLQVEKASSATSISNAQNDNALKLSNYSTAADGQFVSLGLSVAGTSGASADSVIAGFRDGAGDSSLRFYTENGNTLGERMRISSTGAVSIPSATAAGSHLTIGNVHGKLTFSNNSGTAGTTNIQQTYSGSTAELRFGSNVATTTSSAMNISTGDAGAVKFNGLATFSNDVDYGDNARVYHGNLPNSGPVAGGNDTFNFNFTFSGTYGVALITLDVAAGAGEVAAGRYTLAVSCAANTGTTTALMGSVTEVFKHNLSSLTFADSGSQNRTFTLSFDRTVTAETWAPYGSYKIDVTNNNRTLTLNSITTS